MKTDVVLLPGMHGSTALYDAFVALAPPWARCLPVPLPRLGGQDVDSLAGTLEAELRRLEGFVLVAESYSGPIAARLAARLGQKVGLLVLCNPLVEMSVGLPAGLAASSARWQGMPAWMAGAVLAILGSRDRLVSPDRTRSLLQSVPFSTVVELDAPHLVVQTKPAEVWDAITGEFESAA